MSEVISFLLNYQYVIFPFICIFISLIIVSKCYHNLACINLIDMQLNDDKQCLNELVTPAIRNTYNIISLFILPILFTWTLLDICRSIILLYSYHHSKTAIVHTHMEIYPIICLSVLVITIIGVFIYNKYISNNVKEINKIANKEYLQYIHENQDETLS